MINFDQLEKIKVLGRGAYGTVHLVRDKQMNEYALKIINKKKLQKEPYLQEYLQDEISFMKKISQMKQNKYLVAFHQDYQNDQNYYILLEYCVGGDLTHEQMKQPGMIFSLQKAVPILSQVIRGLQQIHKEEYIHRDLKTDNVLIQINQKDSEKIYKLADFGFTKLEVNSSGTVLGTQYYMSPEVYSQGHYKFQVDMWAFGVLFFFMLTKEYPFQLSIVSASPQAKKKKLLHLAKDFSFKKAVKQTNLKMHVQKYCTKQMEDLFKRIFELDPEKRISFMQIRRHPVFIEHFKQYDQSVLSCIYKPKLNSVVHKPGSSINKIPAVKVTQGLTSDNITTSSIQKKPYIIMLKELEQINFLYYNESDFISQMNLNYDIKICLSYHYLRMHLILLKEFQIKIKTEQEKAKSALRKDIIDQIQSIKVKSYHKYQQRIDYIKSVRQGKNNYQTEEQYNLRKKSKQIFEGTIIPENGDNFDKKDNFFEKSYEKAMLLGYKSIKRIQSDKKDQLLLITVISYLYLQIREQPRYLEQIFKQFFQETKIQIDLQFIQNFRIWIRKQQKNEIIKIASALFKRYNKRNPLQNPES